jgi:hypothetical protein
MKKLLFGAAVFSLIAGSAPALAAGNVCISTRDIENSKPADDGSAIDFHMRDGSVWHNDLQGRCPDLKFDGYVWNVRNPDQTVCEREQSLRVLRSGEVCVLGKFTQIKPARAAEKHAEK